MSRLSHLDDRGAANMVDVSAKTDTIREAVAEGRIEMSSDALEAVREGSASKGDVLAVARVAGIMAAKRTSDLIPLCHPLPITRVSVEFSFEEGGIRVTSSARVNGPTGVEMEALTATSVALLTLYDMTKSVDKHMIIKDIMLVSKIGGKSGPWQREP